MTEWPRKSKHKILTKLGQMTAICFSSKPHANMARTWINVTSKDIISAHIRYLLFGSTSSTKQLWPKKHNTATNNYYLKQRQTTNLHPRRKSNCKVSINSEKVKSLQFATKRWNRKFQLLEKSVSRSLGKALGTLWLLTTQIGPRILLRPLLLHEPKKPTTYHINKLMSLQRGISL